MRWKDTRNRKKAHFFFYSFYQGELQKLCFAVSSFLFSLYFFPFFETKYQYSLYHKQAFITFSNHEISLFNQHLGGFFSFNSCPCTFLLLLFLLLLFLLLLFLLLLFLLLLFLLLLFLLLLLLLFLLLLFLLLLFLLLLFSCNQLLFKQPAPIMSLIMGVKVEGEMLMFFYVLREREREKGYFVTERKRREKKT
jgi:hypothetical protein